ncbi:MAG: ArnT family glycosyltransferase [Nitrospiraceae bacterium]
MISDPPPNQAVKLLALLALSGLLFFLGLGDMGLTDRDEGRNAEAGREMFASGDLLTPTFNGELRVAKPVFVYWLMTLSYHVFGVSEFAARVPSALFGVALILMQYLFLSRLRGQAAGLFGALMLLLNTEMLALGRMAITDSVLIFFTTLSLYGFWLGLHGTGARRHWMWGFYVGMALATLTKGPVGFAVPLTAAFLYLTAARRWAIFWQQGLPIAGTLLFVLLAGPWYAAMFLIHGDAYSSQAKVHTVGRFLSPMEGHGGGVWFYIPVLLLGFFPWSLLLPVAIQRAYRSWKESRKTTGTSAVSLDSRDAAASSSELEWFAALWVVGVFVFFTLSSTRLPHYIGPLFPAAALLAASYWSQALTDPSTRGIRGSIHAMTGVGYLLAIGFASVPTVYGKFSGKMVKEFPLAVQFDLGSGPYLAAALLLVGMGLVSYFGLSEERRAAAFGAAGGVVATVFLLVILTVIPGINRYAIAPPQELAYAAGLNLAPADQLIAYGSTRPSMAFYARRKLLFISSGEVDRLRAALAHQGRTMILLPEAMQGSLPREAATFQPILKRYGYLLLASQPMVTIPEAAAPAQTSPPKPLGH